MGIVAAEGLSWVSVRKKVQKTRKWGRQRIFAPQESKEMGMTDIRLGL